MSIGKIGLLIMVGIFLTGCGMLGGGNSLTVKTKDGEAKQVDLKSGNFITQKDRVSSGDVTEHLVCLANFEMKLPADAKGYDLDKKVGDEGQIKVCFTLNGQEGFNENAEIEAKTYQVASFAGGYSPDHVGLATKIYTFEGGKADRVFLKPNGTKGEVEITSASAEKISGNINLHDDKNEIKGAFTAERIGKG